MSPIKFRGDAGELEELIGSAGIKGNWQDAGDGRREFRSRDGGVLSWWPSTGTVTCQGSVEGKAALETALGDITSAPRREASSVGRQIFIVHGHDKAARDDLELTLHRLGLKPFILMNSSGGGKTIIEALEGKIGKDYSSDFGIVLITPDDVGYEQTDGPEKAEPRARQNVVLETGMLLASLTRERMAILIKGHLELPSDLQGVIHYGFNVRIAEIVPKLVQRLQEVGFTITAEQIAAASQ